MGCKAAWTRKPWTPRARARSWMSIIENERRDVLFERERAYFSEAQVEVEVIRAIKRGQAIVIKLVTISTPSSARTVSNTVA